MKTFVSMKHMDKIWKQYVKIDMSQLKYNKFIVNLMQKICRLIK